MTTEGAASESMFQVEWITGTDARWPKTCEWRLPERCQQRPVARLIWDGALTLYICEEHALEYRRGHGIEIDERPGVRARSKASETR
jgi:hypothetical protein